MKAVGVNDGIGHAVGGVGTPPTTPVVPMVGKMVVSCSKCRSNVCDSKRYVSYFAAVELS